MITTITPIPVADPGAQYRARESEIREAIDRVLGSGWYVLGPEVTAFESEFAEFTGCNFGVGVGSGTDALALALCAVGVDPGDEVLTVSHSAVATVTAIEQIGAVPVFCDVAPASRCLDPTEISKRVSRRTRAIVPVHVYGHPASMAVLVDIARRYGLHLVEDCAQAHGATLDGKPVGSFGDAAAFSFYPTKNLGALGDGGAVVTNDPHVDARLRALRQYGWGDSRCSDTPGYNSRLDELQAAILRAKLPYLAEDIERRRAIAERYDAACERTAIEAPSVAAGARPAYHLYVVETDDRNGLARHLSDRGISTGRHYEWPIHRQPAYAGRIRGHDQLPATERLYTRLLSLPMYPEMDDSAVDRVCDAIRSWSD